MEHGRCGIQRNGTGRKYEGTDDPGRFAGCKNTRKQHCRAADRKHKTQQMRVAIESLAVANQNAMRCHKYVMSKRPESGNLSISKTLMNAIKTARKLISANPASDSART